MRVEKSVLNDALRVLGKVVCQTSPVELYRLVRFAGDENGIRAMVTDGKETVSVMVDAFAETEIDFCVPFKVMLRYDDPFRGNKKDDCFRRASYLAKTNTKGTAPKGQRELFSSRIPKSST